MRTDTHLTIQDYFRQGGVGRARRETDTSTSETGGAAQRPFAEILAHSRVTSDDAPRGWTIRDYRARPVPRRHFAPVDPPTSRTPLPPPVRSGSTRAGEPVAGLPSTATELSHEAKEPQGMGDDQKSRIRASIRRAAERYRLPPTLIEAVVQAESDYDVRAVSPAGAQGLMQLMPATAKELGVSDPFDIDQNIHGGARYLRSMLNRFQGDLELALKAYNAGPGTVARFNGRVPYAETRQYVQRVMTYARRLSAVSGNGTEPGTDPAIDSIT